jgi:hypothetical protein
MRCGPQSQIRIAGADARGLPRFAIFAIRLKSARAAWSLPYLPFGRSGLPVGAVMKYHRLLTFEPTLALIAARSTPSPDALSVVCAPPLRHLISEGPATRREAQP